jgi:hypothetical protein
MPDIIQREHLDTNPVDCLKEELKTASDGRQAVSRYGLAETVAERTGMPFEQAQLLVDAFCDENAPHVPAYLKREFNLFWPKVLAFAFAVGGIAVFWYGMGLARAKKPAWLWFAVGTVIFGIGVFQWVRGLERYQNRAAQRRAAKEARLKEKYARMR